MAVDFLYNVSSAVVDDGERETDEGFILYFDFDEDEANPDDLSRLRFGTGAILITIRDDDGNAHCEITCSVVASLIFKVSVLCRV